MLGEGWAFSCLFCAVVVFWLFVSYGSVCTSHLCHSALCVLDSLHRAARRVGVMWRSRALSIHYQRCCSPPPPYTIPSCLGWRGLLALVGITTERAAACLPPRLIELGCCQPAVGRVPNAADLAVIDIYNLKAISQMTWRFSNPLNSLQNIKHMASIHAGDS